MKMWKLECSLRPFPLSRAIQSMSADRKKKNNRHEMTPTLNITSKVNKKRIESLRLVIGKNLYY